MLPLRAAATSAPILYRHLGEAFGIEDGKLVHGLLPIPVGATPVAGDVTQRQPDQLRGGLVGGEVTAGLDDLAQPRVHALDRVGGVDHFAHRGREREERDHLRPGPSPPGRHARVALAVGAHLELTIATYPLSVSRYPSAAQDASWHLDGIALMGPRALGSRSAATL